MKLLKNPVFWYAMALLVIFIWVNYIIISQRKRNQEAYEHIQKLNI